MSAPGNGNLKSRLWHPAKGSDVFDVSNTKVWYMAQDFYLLSLIMMSDDDHPNKRLSSSPCWISFGEDNLVLEGMQPLQNCS